jgi:CheY-like chemotaxis protein
MKISVLIVEDEPLIAMATEDMVTELGYEVTGTATSVEAALSALLRRRPDIALLDLKLRSETSLAVADRCRSLGIGIAFTTGYAPDELPADCGDAPMLAKPYTVAELRTVLERAEGMASSPLN